MKSTVAGGVVDGGTTGGAAGAGVGFGGLTTSIGMGVSLDRSGGAACVVDVVVVVEVVVLVVVCDTLNLRMRSSRTLNPSANRDVSLTSSARSGGSLDGAPVVPAAATTEDFGGTGGDR